MMLTNKADMLKKRSSFENVAVGRTTLFWYLFQKQPTQKLQPFSTQTQLQLL